MQACKVAITTVIGFLAFIGLITIFAIKSCSSTVTSLVNQAFDIPQQLEIKDGVYYITAPLKSKDFFLELSSPNLQKFCINIEKNIYYQRAEGGEQCFNGSCRFFFNQNIPETFEYLTEDNNGQCTVVNKHMISQSEVKRLYEISILVPEEVSAITKGQLKLIANNESRFDSSSHLSIGGRSRVDLEYSAPVINDQLLINNTLFKIEARTKEVQ